MKTKHSGLSFVQARHTNASLVPNGREKNRNLSQTRFSQNLQLWGCRKSSKQLEQPIGIQNGKDDVL